MCVLPGQKPADPMGLSQNQSSSGALTAIYTTDKAGEPLRAVDAATLEAGKGLVGDRYYRHEGTFSEKLKNKADWEITLIEAEEVERYNESTGAALGPGVFRRNLVTRGVRLNDLVGRRFRVGEALLEGLRLCEPCAHLDSLIGPGVVRAMAHRAGLRARILTGAVIRPGDVVAARSTREPADH